MKDRSMVIVVRNKKILMEKLYCYGRYFYSLPGGKIEEGETPEQAAVRELKEECGLDGSIERLLTALYRENGMTEYVYSVKVPKEQEAIVGCDPEDPADEQAIKDVCWLSLDQISEKDRAFLWSYGLMDVDGFFDEIVSWGDEISYPKFLEK